MVVSDLETFKCIIEDVYNGIVTRRNDVESLAQAIIYLLQKKDARITMKENAWRRIREGDFPWQRIAEKTERVYKQVLGWE